jgi:NADH dehydrogenase
MRVLVTGGTGVVGQAAVAALVERGHTARVLSRHAEHDAAEWPQGVEPFDGSVTDPAGVRGSADGCDAVLHLVAIVAESPPEATFDRINVEGTRVMVREAERAGVRRFVHVSSLGAERGQSEYHRSKLAAEQIVRGFSGQSLVVRPANVYGPGDDQISLLLKLVRSLPVVPVLDGGDEQFQPIWVGDAGAVLALAVERDDLAGAVLEIAGAERTSINDLLDRFERICDRHPLRLPVPAFLSSLGLKVAEKVGVDVPFSEGQLTMLRERNVIEPPERNALTSVFCLTPTPLDEGLRKLADSLPELTPADGVGTLKRKRFWADILGSRWRPEALFEHFRRNFDTITPGLLEVGAEPGTPTEPAEVGTTLTLALPVRGHIQVRVEELTPTSMTLMTLEGHALAGAVRFLAEQRGDRVRFEVQVYDRAANVVDWLAMVTVGGRAQNATWKRLVEKVVEASAGSAPGGVEHETVALDDEKAAKVEEWLEQLVAERKRRERESELGTGDES